MAFVLVEARFVFALVLAFVITRIAGEGMTVGDEGRPLTFSGAGPRQERDDDGREPIGPRMSPKPGCDTTLLVADSAHHIVQI